ncbi:hypothetical protein ACFOZ1_03300 [Gracilibacillus marinus]|uniref:Uncharacterized protein n=1 Tax=Gracilibacillus marinus TaxID=630535 RepID=A0ABV8VRK2_9BACI
MKKVAVICLCIIIFFFVSPAFGKDELGYIIWHHHMYEVSDERITVEDIEHEVGFIESNQDSNIYPIGTILYKVKGIDEHEELAISDESYYRRAHYVKDVAQTSESIFYIIMPYIFLFVLICLYVVREEYKHILLSSTRDD